MYNLIEEIVDNIVGGWDYDLSLNEEEKNDGKYFYDTKLTLFNKEFDLSFIVDKNNDIFIHLGDDIYEKIECFNYNIQEFWKALLFQVI